MFILTYIIVAFLIVIIIHKRTTVLKPCYRVIRQCHNIYYSYEPMLLINLCLIAKRHMNAINIATICLIILMASLDIVYTLWRSWHVKLFLASNDGPIQKVRYFLYCLIVMLIDRHHFRLGTLMSIGFGMAVLVVKVYQLLKYGCVWPSVISVRHLKYFQRYVNEISFIAYNVVLVRLGITHDYSQWYGYYLLGNFSIFMMLNAIMILWGIIRRIKDRKQGMAKTTDK